MKTPSWALLILCLVAGCQQQATNSADDTRASGSGTNAPRTEVDNTARNVRDRAEDALTPGDQGNAPLDRDLTIRIRKAIVSGPEDLSTTAKNIKIITVNGKVTLRGPVKTEAEKSSLVGLAKGVAGEGNVDDRLEVKATP